MIPDPADAGYTTDDNPHKGNRGLARAWHAAKNSWSGLVFAVREESAFRQELTLAALLIPLALILPFAALERLMLIGSVVLVLIVELVNSGVEAAIDRISFEHHGLSKRAKDYGSAAVMLALLICAMFWITLGWQLVAKG
jgi:diacylglycerol kinase (ATP)